MNIYGLSVSNWVMITGGFEQEWEHGEHEVPAELEGQ